ncbi:DUF6963 family protein [Roseibium aggregatum]|uniref:Uncharacterized protein n=1 Tax=Roseibium aggregatum TaxID=187304 RepID=A0A939J1H9_9HYPH|nr:hypothetical protein [Roseibium aggregatum]MBN9672161.1 hypothetical protein [Roseibium aggregatum]
MTIGIALSGPNAGLGIFRALAAVEKIGRGAVGGFVSYAALTEDGRLLRAQTQDGGTSTLFGGAEPPAELAAAKRAVLMSSGPNRPEPLAQFTPGEVGVALITGHRLPNVSAGGGVAPNVRLLDALRQGTPVQDAVASVLEANGNADAGLIALTSSGEIAMGDTEFVRMREDRGSLLFSSGNNRLTGAVIHNSIFPVRGVTELVAGVALDCFEDPDRSDHMLRIDETVAIVPSDRERVHVDGNGKIVSVDVARGRIEDGYLEGSIFLYQSPVFRDGELIGHISGEEPYTIVRDYHAVSFSGKGSARIALKEVMS